jgi:hypothetical protein
MAASAYSLRWNADAVRKVGRTTSHVIQPQKMA